MSDNPLFYRARADEQRAASADARLDNVKERCDRAAAAWDAMAARAERTQALRQERESRTIVSDDIIAADS